MVLSAKRSIEQSVISTKITIDSYGTADMPAEIEKEILHDYKITIDYGKILFSRYVGVDEHQNLRIVRPDPESEDPIDADLVTLAMPIESYAIDENMELTYAIDISKLDSRITSYKYLQDPMCVGKACCLVFETVVADYIHDQLEVSKRHKDTFEDLYTYVV